MISPVVAHEATSPIKEILREAFGQAYVKRPDTAIEYREHTDDFGVQIKELWVVGHDDEYVDNCTHLRQDIHQVAKQLGIISRNVGVGYYPRDFFIKDHRGKILGPMRSSKEKVADLETAIRRANSKEVYAEASGASLSLTKNRSISGKFGHCAKLAELVIASGLGLPTSPFYFEGGNLFTLTNSQKEIKVLSGKMHLFTTLNWLRLNKWPLSQEKISAKVQELDELTIRKVAEKMYSQGLLKQEGKSGLIDESNLTLEQIKELFIKCSVSDCSVAEGFFQLGHAKKFSWQTTQSAECREMVAKYLCQKELAKGFIADALKVQPRDVIYLPSCDAHLDLFLRPGPGCLFLADYSLSEKVCALFHLHAAKLNLANDDRKHLEIYRRSAQKRQAELGTLLAKTKRQLEKAGFCVVPMPGIFTYDGSNIFAETYNFSFMNAVTGWSEVTKRYFYIVGGVEVGKLGPLFMDALKAFIEQYAPQTDIYFVGRYAEPNKFSEIMKIMNTFGRSYGNVHCSTFEALTLTHKNN